jgi:C1A family cysteine protease
MGGHCILIVGYNENGFIIRNSWGNLFGNKGYTLLPYNEFNSIFEAWTIIA